MKKNAIALLITLFFIMAITVSISIGLKNMNKASNEYKNDLFMFQTSILLDDILKVLQQAQELNAIVENDSPESLYLFLSQSSFIPLQSNGYEIIIEISSARSKFNINTLVDANATIDEQKLSALQSYMNNNMVDAGYVDILLDGMSGNKEDLTYNTELFDNKPYLFRDYIASEDHLEVLNDFYKQKYHSNGLSNIDTDKLFCFNAMRNMSIDVNYASPEVWELLLSTTKERAEQLSLAGGTYTDIETLGLSDDEKNALSRFQVSYFEPYLDITLNIKKDAQSARVRFEYDIKNKKGSNFIYDI